MTKTRDCDDLGSMDIHVHTTSDLSDPSVAWKILEAVSEQFACAIEVLDSRKDHDSWIKLESARKCLSEIYPTGGLAFRASEYLDLAGTIGWEKYSSHRERERSRRKHGASQNVVFLCVPLEHLTNGYRQLLRVIKRVSVLVRANYAVGRRLKRPDDYKYGTISGLAVGLRDIYDINVFGRPYVEMIGHERLLSVPNSLADEFAPGLILVVPGGRSLVSIADFEKARETARRHIGAEYFISNTDRSRGRLEEKSILGLVSFLLGTRRQFTDESFSAAQRPVFDWAEMVESGKE